MSPEEEIRGLNWNSNTGFRVAWLYTTSQKSLGQWKLKCPCVPFSFLCCFDAIQALILTVPLYVIKPHVLSPQRFEGSANKSFLYWSATVVVLILGLKLIGKERWFLATVPITASLTETALWCFLHNYGPFKLRQLSNCVIMTSRVCLWVEVGARQHTVCPWPAGSSALRLYYWIPTTCLTW